MKYVLAEGKMGVGRPPRGGRREGTFVKPKVRGCYSVGGYTWLIKRCHQLCGGVSFPHRPLTLK